MNKLDISIKNSYSSHNILELSAVGYLAKQIDRWFITNIYAPIKKSQAKKIKSSLKENISQIGYDTKVEIENLTKQLDDSLKGKFSEKVQSTMEEKAKEYDAL